MKAWWTSVCVVLAGVASGQVVVIDQESPGLSLRYPVSFNLDDPLWWLQQIRGGRSGVLDGIEIGVTGPVGAQCHFRIRLGSLTPLQPVVFETLVTKETAAPEAIYVDLRSAGIRVRPGETFVMDTQGNKTGMWLLGNGTPALYPEPLWVDQGGFLPVRHGFTTFVLIDCYADCDGTGVLDFFDFLCYQNAFASGDAFADCDEDRALTLLDFLCFEALFLAGCT